MSWSFAAVGKAAAVAAKAREAKESGKCIEPEESYRLDALESIARFSETLVNSAVKVSASGSMWKDGEVVKSHSMAVNFEPLYNFVE